MTFGPRNPQTTALSLSPLMLAGMVLKPLPVGPLNMLLHHMAKKLGANHPAILERLQPLVGTEFLICPIDLPHDIRLRLEDGQVSCQIEDEFLGTANVKISGPLLSLIDMLDGKIDGDALFFSRSLTVEGDTEALLTLRNAMDSDEIDIRAEILEPLGLLKKPAESLLTLGGHLYQNLSRHMDQINQAITSPLSLRCDSLEEGNQDLRHKISHLEKMLGKTQNRLQSLSRKITS